ncbi:MAG TPA: FAD:protein FMN transferase [Candidatus Polarisedimenticolaceae bacterium]|nr:FAD:protein FMN transferase [Candidatus Polarisedimenticolaceae bacterium]
MDERTLYTTRFALMGGSGLIRFVDRRGRTEAQRLARAAEAEALRIEWKFSRYREASVVSEITRNAGRTPVAVDDETELLVAAALDLARLTRGRFDPTVGVLRRAWDFRARRVPAPDEIAALLPLVNFEAVSIREKTVFLRRPGMELDLGGVGKEYAADRVADLLEEGGVESALINFAGDVRTVGGRGDGWPWSVGVADPREAGRVRFALRFPGAAGVATSGDYERCFVVDGVRYHHLLDATTGRPARGVASATVLARTAFEAGRLATASFLLGADEGLTVIARGGAEGALVLEDGSIRATPGMDRYSDLPGSLYAAYPAI